MCAAPTISLTVMTGGRILSRGIFYSLVNSSGGFDRSGSGSAVTGGCRCFHKSTPRETKFHRAPKAMYMPLTDGIVPKKESLRQIPKDKPDDKFAKTVEQLKTSGEVFKSIMGEIKVSKNKHLIAVEGVNVVEDAIKFGLKLKTLFLLRSLKSYPENVARIVSEQGIQNSADAPPSALSKNYSGEERKLRPEVHQISQRNMEEWSFLTTPPGIIGIFERPSDALKKKNYYQYCSVGAPVPLTVVLDNIRDPGNLGSILRTAAGIGCKVLLSNGCADPWDTKALRGGNGAQFFVPITADVDFNYFHQYIPLSDLSNESTGNGDAHGEQFSTNGNGNLNDGIYEKSGIGIFLADGGVDVDALGLPSVPYTSIKYSSYKSVYVILGGENLGLSDKVKKVSNDLKKIYPEDVRVITRINIPMLMPVDSLNVANAFGVIGYEIARQYMKSST